MNQQQLPQVLQDTLPPTLQNTLVAYVTMARKNQRNRDFASKALDGVEVAAIAYQRDSSKVRAITEGFGRLRDMITSAGTTQQGRIRSTGRIGD